jgi:hypothetical protein
MEPEDDPEARIRDLERQLSARTSELGVDSHGSAHGYVQSPSESYPPPPPGAYPPGAYPPPPPTTPWDTQYPPMAPMSNTGTSRGVLIPVVIAVLAFVIAGGVSLYLFTKGTPSGLNRPDISGGGATLSDERPSTGGGKTQLPSRGATAPNTPPVGQEPAPPPGTTVIVSGIGENKTIACNETILTVSGIENTVTVSGHCASLSVSGVDNVITVDSTVSIVVSGFDNRIVFHTGEPETSTSGSGNTIDRG